MISFRSSPSTDTPHAMQPLKFTHTYTVELSLILSHASLFGNEAYFAAMIQPVQFVPITSVSEILDVSNAAGRQKLCWFNTFLEPFEGFLCFGFLLIYMRIF